jgi:2-oxo-4-hydroxy-4-carboxy--5-ureidoimidazoline (OHCU) decarboxylase
MSSLPRLNALAPTDFGALLGGVFEKSPWVAAEVRRTQTVVPSVSLTGANADRAAAAV